MEMPRSKPIVVGQQHLNERTHRNHFQHQRMQQGFFLECFPFTRDADRVREEHSSFAFFLSIIRKEQKEGTGNILKRTYGTVSTLRTKGWNVWNLQNVWILWNL